MTNAQGYTTLWPAPRVCLNERRYEEVELSARNSIPGTVKAVRMGEVMAEVTISIGESEVVAVITRSSAERMKLAVGDRVSAVIKATEVMISK